eukprot:1160690-Pelagomonas_calceolata.AAC.8
MNHCFTVIRWQQGIVWQPGLHQLQATGELSFGQQLLLPAEGCMNDAERASHSGKRCLAWQPGSCSTAGASTNSIASLQDEQERRSRWQRGGNKRESLQYRGGNKYISTENRYPAPVPRGGAGARTAYVLGRHKPAIAMHCCC